MLEVLFLRIYWKLVLRFHSVSALLGSEALWGASPALPLFFYPSL